MLEFLNRTIGAPQHKDAMSSAAPLVDGVCIHSYNNDGGDGWTKPGFVSQTLRQVEVMKREVRRRSSTMPLWCGECGPHNRGGVVNVTDRFISSLWYTDTLGALATVGVSEFGRQSLVGSHYSLLDVNDGFSPNPDFYAAVLWQRIMGARVLKAEVSVAERDPTGGYARAAAALDALHVYAHCGASKYGHTGRVALAFVNIDQNASFAALRCTWKGLHVRVTTSAAAVATTAQEAMQRGRSGTSPPLDSYPSPSCSTATS